MAQLDTFLAYNPAVNISQLQTLLDAHAKASAGGFLNTSRPRWDYAGSLYYVGTLVSTIGGLTALHTRSQPIGDEQTGDLNNHIECLQYVIVSCYCNGCPPYIYSYS